MHEPYPHVHQQIHSGLGGAQVNDYAPAALTHKNTQVSPRSTACKPSHHKSTIVSQIISTTASNPPTCTQWASWCLRGSIRQRNEGIEARESVAPHASGSMLQLQQRPALLTCRLRGSAHDAVQHGQPFTVLGSAIAPLCIPFLHHSVHGHHPAQTGQTFRLLEHFSISSHAVAQHGQSLSALGKTIKSALLPSLHTFIHSKHSTQIC
mmetsp:Transcript_74749/g.125946  ORF Transcript_74749/g.125946 Transcript_74749/m.125946 type:complete len:208 (-) Transcript_74749:1425-2048(-)